MTKAQKTMGIGKLTLWSAIGFGIGGLVRETICLEPSRLAILIVPFGFVAIGLFGVGCTEAGASRSVS